MNKVYLIQSQENSYYKFGVSKHPQKRLKEHQTGNPSPLKLIDVYSSDIAYKIENVLLNRYSHVKIEGEWYDLGIVNEVTFVSECKKIEEKLRELQIKNH